MDGAVEPEAEQLRNENPAVLTSSFLAVSGFLEVYGWALAAVVVLIGYLVYTYRGRFERWNASRLQRQQEDEWNESGSMERMDAGLEAARLRMMDQQKRATEAYQQKLNLDEQRRAQQKIDDYDKMMKGESQLEQSTRRPDDHSQKPASSSRPKNQLRRNDYNPLTGTAGTSYRPEPRHRQFQRGG